MIRLFEHSPKHLAEDYAYDMEKEGVNNLWRIYHVTTNNIVAYVVFWKCEHEWAARAQAKARLIVSALNEYANREVAPPVPKKPRFRLSVRSQGRHVSIIDTSNKDVLLEAQEDQLVWMGIGEAVRNYRFIADALNAFGNP